MQLFTVQLIMDLDNKKYRNNSAKFNITNETTGFE